MSPRQQMVVVAVVLVVVGAVDFLQRVHVPRAPTTRESQDESPELPAVPLSLALARERLQSWFPTQPAAQQGSLIGVPGVDGTAAIPDRADIGGWRFVLRGVFDAGPPFAVLDVMESSGGAVEQHRLSAGEVIRGVRVEQIAGRKVSLSDGDRVIQLALFVDPEDNVDPTSE